MSAATTNTAAEAASQANNLAGGEFVSSLTLLGKVSATLIFIIVLILACAWLFRRIGNAWLPKTANRIHVITSSSLGGKERIVVVDVEGKRLVLGVGPGSVNCLSAAEIPADEHTEGEAADAEKAAISSPFARIFSKYAATPGNKQQHTSSKGREQT